MRHLHFTVLPVLASVCSLAPLGCGSPSDDDPFIDSSERAEHFSTGLAGEPVHESVTAAGLAFLREEVVTAVTAGNVEADVQFIADNAYHFDDCNFSGASANISSEEENAVGHLDPATPTPDHDGLAMIAFGHALHIAQDFYAHSNWVELGETELVDASLDPFPTLDPYSTVDVDDLVVEGQPPSGMGLWRNQGAPYPENAIVYVQTRKQKLFGLISGTVDYEPGNDCPAQVAMTHEELNKDHATDAGKTAQHEAAVDLATRQTAHEWCRLLTLTREAYGDPGDQRLALWVADAGAAYACGDPGDLNVGITDVAPNPVELGGAVRVTLTYGNAGPAGAFGTRISLDLPSGLTPTHASADAASCTMTTAGDVECYVGALAASGTGSIQIDATATVTGEQTLSAVVSAHLEDGNPANDTSVSSLTVNAVAAQ
jgi:hypothetical protein